MLGTQLSSSVYSLSGLHRLTWQERRAKLVSEGRVEEGVMGEATRSIDEEVADKMIENVVGVLGVPLAMVPDVPINGKLLTLPCATEEPSVVAAISRAAKLLRGSAKGVQVTVGPSVAHGMAVLQMDQEICCVTSSERVECESIDGLPTGVVGWDEVWKYVEGLDLKASLDATHPALVANGGGFKDVKMIPISQETVYLDVAVGVADSFGANAASLYAAALSKLVTNRFPSVSSLASIVMNGEDERVASVESLISAADYAKATGCDIVDARHQLKRVASLSSLASHCAQRCYTHNKGILNGVEAVALALGQDTRAVSIANSALMHRAGTVHPLIAHTFNTERDCLVSSGAIAVPVGSVGGCLRHQHQSRALLSLLGTTLEVEEALAAVGLCSNISALLMLVGPGGLERGHMPLARK